jgi:CubicO group peptidase (beta-lactamase class C family)
MLADAGRLDLDAPVADYWPEFAQAGKDAITVSDLLSHQAGLAWVDDELTLEQVLASDPLVEALARQAPIWEPRSAHGYHAVTYGTLVGEVVRRVDGRSLGTFFADEVAAPLALDFFIGLPEEHEPRVAMLVGNLGSIGGGDGALGGPDMDPDTRAALEALVGPTSMLGRALSVNGALGRFDDIPAPAGNVFNSREVHAAEIPAAGGITDARSLARMYAACIGEVDGVRLLTEARMRDAATQRTVGPNIVILNLDLQFGLGYFVRSSLINLGGPASFGHAGAGGSLGWADPDAELACGYVMNRMDLGIAGDDRSFSLVNACYAALAG